jgi:hypothetical protein
MTHSYSAAHFNRLTPSPRQRSRPCLSSPIAWSALFSTAFIPSHERRQLPVRPGSFLQTVGTIPRSARVIAGSSCCNAPGMER